MYHKIVSFKLNRVFFSQFYWLKVTNSFNKKPTCFKVGFFDVFRFFRFVQIIDLYIFILVRFA